MFKESFYFRRVLLLKNSALPQDRPSLNEAKTRKTRDVWTVVFQVNNRIYNYHYDLEANFFKSKGRDATSIYLNYQIIVLFIKCQKICESFYYDFSK